MKELENIWAELPKQEVSSQKIDQYIEKKSKLELEIFGRILKIEIYVALGALLLLLPFQKAIEMEILMISFLAILTALILGLITMRKLKKIQFMSDVKVYLSDSIRFLKSYIWLFSISIQLVLMVTFFILKGLSIEEIGWMEWIFSGQGVNALLIALFIEIFSAVYAYMFYYRRILKLSKLLTEI